MTDDDTIEKSNLSRQFLFRDWNIGDFKAAVAGKAAQSINPDFRAKLLQNRVSPETEDVFTDDFWQVRLHKLLFIVIGCKLVSCAHSCSLAMLCS